MKKIIIIHFLFVLGLSGLAQVNTHEMNKFRDSIMNKYITHADTVTRNTWLNIMHSNNLLEQIIHYDSMIMQASTKTDQNDSLRIALLQELQDTEGKLIILEQQKSQLDSDLDFFEKMYYMALILSALFLVIIAILLLLNSRQNKASKEKDKKVKEYYTGLYNARKEIEASRKIENQLASEINKLRKQLTHDHKDENEALEKLSQEKLMLENQIGEVKKAYEMEASKRKELEIKVQDELQDDKSETIDTLNTRIQVLQKNYEALQAENQQNKKKLEQAKKEEDEIEALKKNLSKIDKDLAAMEKRFNDLSEKLNKTLA